MAMLTNLTIVNTRPAHQAEPLNALLQSMGANVINLPTLEIKPTNASDVKKTCEQLHKTDIVVFVSANAAHCSHAYWPKPFPSKKILAIGPGTASALKSYGLTDITMPEKFNTEGLLETPLLQSIQNKTIMIFCGERSRPTLRETLVARDANVIVCECYTRQCPKADANSISLLKETHVDGIISTSHESLKNLESLLSNLHADFKKTPLVVISPEMAVLAKQFGWKTVFTAENASDSAVIDRLTKLKTS